MFEYTYPIIDNINDVLPYIENDKSFVVLDKGNYTVVDYVITTPKTHPIIRSEEDISAKIRRECRGLIFDKKGKLISRPFEKFFNIGEKEWTQPAVLPHFSNAVVQEKLDGSMIRPLMRENEFGEIDWRLATRKGITDTALQAEQFMMEIPRNVFNAYNSLFIKCWYDKLTPIFEWISPENKIVITHRKANLVLLAIRNMHGGIYVTDVDHYLRANHSEDVPFVPQNRGTDYVEDLFSMQNYIRAAEDIEGVVIQFNRQHRVKLKSDWYVNLHRIKAGFGTPFAIFNALFDNQLDDVQPVLQPSQLRDIARFERRVFDEIERVTKEYEIAKATINANNLSKKDVALDETWHVTDPYKIQKSIILTNWERTDSAHDIIMDFINRNRTSKSRFGRITALLNLPGRIWPVL